MFKLRIVQANYGDCFILEYGTAAEPRYALVDGGPSTVYRKHLRNELRLINSAGGHLDFVALSHIDDDHVKGLLDFTDELCKQKESGKPLTITIDALLHNSFIQTMGADVMDGYRSWMDLNPSKEKSIFKVDRSERSIFQGDKLTRSAEKLEIPINPGIDFSEPISLGDSKSSFTFGNLTLQVLGPTERNLESLQQAWLEWLEQQGSKDLLAPSDQTVPNVSSLMFLARVDEKKILLTGDGRSDDLVEGLRKAGLTDSQDCMHVDILKLPHHGSLRNISRDFFYKVTADCYVISANGRDNNPDLDTLQWIVEAARDQNRKIVLFVTNKTSSIEALLSQRPPEQFNYRIAGLEAGDHSQTITLDEGDGPP